MYRPLAAVLLAIALLSLGNSPHHAVQHRATVVNIHNQSSAQLAVYVVRPPHLVMRLGDVAAHTDERFTIPDFFTAEPFFVHVAVRGGVATWDSQTVMPVAGVGTLNITISEADPQPDGAARPS